MKEGAGVDKMMPDFFIITFERKRTRGQLMKTEEQHAKQLLMNYQTVAETETRPLSPLPSHTSVLPSQLKEDKECRVK